MDRWRLAALVLAAIVLAGVVQTAGARISSCEWPAHPNCWPKPADRIVTVYNNATVTVTPPPAQPPPQPVVTVTAAPEPPTGKKTAVFRQEHEPAKYAYNVDFTWRVCVGQEPTGHDAAAGCKPWTGNGYPWVIVDYLESGYHTWLNDTGIIHNAIVLVYPGIGYDFCGWHVIRYWPEDFYAVRTEQPNHVLRFGSQPASTEPADYFQNGERCPAAAYAQAYVSAVTCMEGDGQITKPWTEQYETQTENVTVQHLDFIDYCDYQNYRTPP